MPGEPGTRGTPSVDALRRRALAVRRDIVGMLKMARAGSLLPPFSAVDILVWLYGGILKVCSEAPLEPERDRFVLSRASAAPALYAVLAERGFFERDELWGYGRLGSLLQGTPEPRRTPGVDVSCGAPGMGVGIALGLALALKDCRPGANVCCLLGAEELRTGSTWESLDRALASPPANLTLIVEHARVPEKVGDAFGSPELASRLSSLGCDVRCADGHDYDSLTEAWASLSKDRLRVVLACTVRGKGLPPLREGVLNDTSILDHQTTELLLRSLEAVSS